METTVQAADHRSDRYERTGAVLCLTLSKIDMVALAEKLLACAR